MERDPLTEQIIGCAYTVQNTLGVGFLEKVYENALVYELGRNGLATEQQVPINVHYDGVIVGEYAADVVVEGKVILELKAIKALGDIHLKQCLNYLKATELRVCLLLNFGEPKLGIKRVML